MIHPPLGSLRPETRHLNLKWTVAVVDEVLRMARLGATSRYIVRMVKQDFGIDATALEIVRMCNDAGVAVGRRERANT